MKQLYLDLVGGIAGDMFLGLLLDLGLDLGELEEALRSLPVSDWSLRVGTEQRLGITGTRLVVEVTAPQPHRHWHQIDALIESSPLPATVIGKARTIFRRLGEAEAKVHGKPLEEIHFHEVGAVDAIVDIVGTVFGLERLGIGRLLAGLVPLGFGTCRTAHGPYPLPAPATAELLAGWPVRDANCDRELVTPTGAALLTTLAEPGPLPAMRLSRTGHGIGGWQLPDRPNLLRGLLGESVDSPLERDSVSVLEAHLDDVPAERLGYLMERLLADGALDVGFSPLQMKKNRPGTRVTLICAPADEAALARRLLRETGSGGVRCQNASRYKFERRSRQIDSEFGPVRVKLFFEAGRLSHATPEFDDCRRLALQHNLPLPEVERRIRQAIDTQIFGTTEQQ